MTQRQTPVEMTPRGQTPGGTTQERGTDCRTTGCRGQPLPSLLFHVAISALDGIGSPLSFFAVSIPATGNPRELSFLRRSRCIAVPFRRRRERGVAKLSSHAAAVAVKRVAEALREKGDGGKLREERRDYVDNTQTDPGASGFHRGVCATCCETREFTLPARQGQIHCAITAPLPPASGRRAPIRRELVPAG